MDQERRKRLGRELGHLLGVVQDVRHLSAMRWRQELAPTGAPLAVRLAVHHGAVAGELRRSYPGLDRVTPQHLALLVLLGVVDAGEASAEVKAVTGLKLR